MDMITAFVLCAATSYIGFKLGQAAVRKEVGNAGVDQIIARTKFPIGVAEKIDGQYYLYEKDTTNFMCQAATLEGLAEALLEKSNISLAVLMCPEEANSEIFWCVNGKLKSVAL